MATKQYEYNGAVYTSTHLLKKAIWTTDRTVISIPDPETAEAWAALVKNVWNEETQQWEEEPLGIVYTVIEDPEPTEEELAEAQLEAAKAQREALVANLTVTVGDKIFDADETSQTRMTRALKVADITGLEETEWVLADNSVVTVTKAEMEEALSKAMLAQAELWVIPYISSASSEEDEEEKEEEASSEDADTNEA